jgi:hypothetical protein
MQEFEVKNSKIKWGEPMIDFTIDPVEIVKQPQVADIISRITD